MKSYHIQNYIRYKKDLEQKLKRLPDLPYYEYDKEQLTIKFMPLVENIGRIAGLLDCSKRTIHRNMEDELKREKELLNKENEKL